VLQTPSTGGDVDASFLRGLVGKPDNNKGDQLKETENVKKKEKEKYKEF
jgi:hypothetical protein